MGNTICLFTKIREILNSEHNFIAPTYIYSDLILELNEKFDIHGMMHGFNTDIIGKIIPGNGKIKIESMFSDKEIVL